MKKSLQKKIKQHVKKLSKLKIYPQLLLHPQIPKPLHSVAPREIMGPAWWNKTRQAAYRKSLYHCEACGISKHTAHGPKWLEGHEVYEVDYLQGRATYIRCVALCHYCHNFIHKGRMQAMLETGKLNHRKYAAVLAHGYRVLGQAGLHPGEEYNGPTAAWSDWRMLFQGKEYPPKYKSLKHQQRVYKVENRK